MTEKLLTRTFNQKQNKINFTAVCIVQCFSAQREGLLSEASPEEVMVI